MFDQFVGSVLMVSQAFQEIVLATSTVTGLFGDDSSDWWMIFKIETLELGCTEASNKVPFQSFDECSLCSVHSGV